MNGTALVLAAHGSDHQPEVNELILRLAREVSQRCGFDESAAGFHQGEPRFSTVLDTLTCDEAIVVPMMTSAGYYANEILPRELRKNRRFEHCRVRVSAPVGTHPAIVHLVLGRVYSAAEQARVRLADASIIIVGHGTRRNPNSRASTDSLVQRLRETGRFGEVLEAFLDQDPELDTLAARMSFAVGVVIPFLIGGGPHAMEDIPRRLEQGRSGDPPKRRFLYTPPVGTLPEIATIVQELALAARDEGAVTKGAGSIGPGVSSGRGGKRLRLGTRGSRLALWQARHVAERLARREVQVELVTISTVGDRDKVLAIHDFPVDAPFTDDIDAAVLAGEVDLAVHSLKDLPLSLRPGLTIAATLPRGSAHECLVSHGHLKLGELRSGGVVGTSSLRRRAQLLALRPDLKTVPLRGAVDERIRRVLAGELDAAVLAQAGIERLDSTEAVAELFDVGVFLPAPGQGALAVVVRDEESATHDLVRALDHAPTRMAVEAELAAFRPFEHSREFALAAHATFDEIVSLHVRLLTVDGQRTWDARSVGSNPIRVAEDALAKLVRQGAPAPTEIES